LSSTPSKFSADPPTAPTQASVVHPLESLHCAAVVQAPGTALLQLPAGSVQVSVVAPTPSLQLALVAQHPAVGAYQL
jgi:hypothetical protein